jgi:SAM-dependent methyltransferase
MAHDELKQRQGAMWGRGDYQRITETIPDIHALVIERLAPAPGMRWLDLACGTGAVAERAAAAGASATGVDLAPALIETAEWRAAQLGLEIRYAVGDCERLELPDAAFDAVSSTCGVMFSPDHAASARELARVTAPGGRIALANWAPGGGIARMFGMMAPFQPAPPPSDPFRWGDPEHVRGLLDDAFELEFEERVSTLRVDSGATPARSPTRASTCSCWAAGASRRRSCVCRSACRSGSRSGAPCPATRTSGSARRSAVGACRGSAIPT